MEIRALDWSGGNEAHLAAHGISRREVLEIVTLDNWAVGNHPDFPGQIRVIGPTRSGRLLTVVMDPTDDAAVWRPVTGWDATAGERAYFREQQP